MEYAELLRAPLPKPEPEKHKDDGSDNAKTASAKRSVRIDWRRRRRGRDGFDGKRARAGGRRRMRRKRSKCPTLATHCRRSSSTRPFAANRIAPHGKSYLVFIGRVHCISPPENLREPCMPGSATPEPPATTLYTAPAGRRGVIARRSRGCWPWA